MRLKSGVALWSMTRCYVTQPGYSQELMTFAPVRIFITPSADLDNTLKDSQVRIRDMNNEQWLNS